VLIVSGQALFFSIQQQISFLLLLVVVLPGLMLGIFYHLLEGPEYHLFKWLDRNFERPLAGFCLFFLILFFYIPFFSVSVSYPVGLLVGAFWGSMDLGRQYMLYSVNSAFVLAAFSLCQLWLTTARSNS
jgi:hypothetical protein